jgi:hypothetical protein
MQGSAIPQINQGAKGVFLATHQREISQRCALRGKRQVIGITSLLRAAGASAKVAFCFLDGLNYSHEATRPFVGIFLKEELAKERRPDPESSFVRTLGKNHI